MEFKGYLKVAIKYSYNFATLYYTIFTKKLSVELGKYQECHVNTHTRKSFPEMCGSDLMGWHTGKYTVSHRQWDIDVLLRENMGWLRTVHYSCITEWHNGPMSPLDARATRGGAQRQVRLRCQYGATCYLSMLYWRILCSYYFIINTSGKCFIITITYKCELVLR